MKPTEFPKGYEDLFDSNGADPEEVLTRARRTISMIQKTKSYTKYLVRRGITRNKKELEELDKVIGELKSIISEKKSRELKELLREKVHEKKEVKNNIVTQRIMLKIMDETLNEKMVSHRKIVESIKSPSMHQQEIKNLKYIG